MIIKFECAFADEYADIKLNVKKAEMWAERGISCVYNGGIAREYWIFFIKKQNVICFFRKKKSWQIVWKK